MPPNTVLGGDADLRGLTTSDTVVATATETSAKPSEVPIAIDSEDRTVLRADDLHAVVSREVNPFAFPVLDLAPADGMHDRAAGVDLASVIEHDLDRFVIDVPALHPIERVT